LVLIKDLAILLYNSSYEVTWWDLTMTIQLISSKVSWTRKDHAIPVATLATPLAKLHLVSYRMAQIFDGEKY